MPGHPFYGTPAWKKARATALRRAAWKCEVCSASVEGKGQYRVDHKVPRALRPDLALDPTNLRVLCFDCDGLRHAHKGSGQPAGLWDDPRGADARGMPTSPTHPWNTRGRK